MSRLIARTLTSIAALAVLAGCGASQSTQSPTPAVGYVQEHSAAALLANSPLAAAQHLYAPRSGGRASWMSPNAKQQDLMYLSDYSGGVYVYSFPMGQAVGFLSGLRNPAGSCADAKGNVWITDGGQQKVFEYAHGGTSPINVLSLSEQAVVGCSVDPQSGALAVDSFCAISNNICVQDGSVFVYQDITKPPQRFGVLKAQNVYLCGYDHHGNLFVDAYVSAQGPFVLGELAKGASTVTPISLDRHIYFPGGVQWHGKYLAVGDQEAGGLLTSSVHQIAISGASGTVVGTTKLQGSGDVVQFWIQGSTIIAPNIGLQAASNVRLYSYPVGGSPAMIIGGLTSPQGATVSLATTNQSFGK